MDHAHSSHLLAQCPLCHAAYPSADVQLVGEKGTTRLFHCTCRTCGHAMLAIVLENQGAVSSVGLMTDLEIQDAMRFREAAVISADDCIAIHRLLEGESQRFCAALRRNPA
jgi:hypothetical protein